MLNTTKIAFQDRSLCMCAHVCACVCVCAESGILAKACCRTLASEIEQEGMKTVCRAKASEIETFVKCDVRKSKGAEFR